MSSVLDRHIIFEDPHGGDNNHGSGLIDDGSDGDDDDDDARVSRLFYLQLYSSVLKAEREAERLRREQRKKNKRKKIAPASLPKLVKSLSWVDVTRLMGGDSNKKRRRDGVSMTSATDMDVEQQLTQTLPVQGGGKKVSRIQVSLLSVRRRVMHSDVPYACTCALRRKLDEFRSWFAHFVWERYNFVIICHEQNDMLLHS